MIDIRWRESLDENDSCNNNNKRRDKRLGVKAFTEEEFAHVEKYNSCFNQTV